MYLDFGEMESEFRSYQTMSYVSEAKLLVLGG